MPKYWATVTVAIELEANDARRATAGAAACIDDRGMQYEYGVNKVRIGSIEVRISPIIENNFPFNTVTGVTTNATLRSSESVESFGTPSETETPNGESNTDI